MNIAGLDMTQISQKMAVFVEEHVKDFKLSGGDSLFAKSYKLHYEEVKDGIPEEHHHLFTGDTWFNGASGIVEVNDRAYILMLLSDENYSTAYLLSVQETDEKGKEQTVRVIVKRNFFDREN